jgi:uroporphyrinogen III methyltransferase/synthase
LLGPSHGKKYDSRASMDRKRGSGKVWLVGAGPGDPSLITVRGLEALGSADVVLYDALSHTALLEACRKDAELRNVGKRGGRQSPSQDWITEQLIGLAREGKQVVRLKGGDPMLFARGAEEAEALSDAAVPFEIVPGLSSPVAAVAYAGIALTHRDLSSSVTFITGSDKAGVDWTPDAWRRIATATETLCVLMGMRRLDEITSALLAGGRSAETPAAIVQWGARPEQRVLVSTLGAVASEARREGFSNPAVIVIGDVVGLREKIRWYDKKPLFGKRLLVPRAVEQARATAKAIRDRAAEAILFPVIQIVDPPDAEPLRKAVAELERYDWVLFTSSNGVERFFAELRSRGADARALGGIRVGAIGPGTGAALESRGIHADLTAREFVGESLAEGVLKLGVRRALLPRALVARDALPTMLREAGAEVDVVPAYATKPVDRAQATNLRELVDGGIDVAMFTSSSTVTGVADLLGEDAATVLGRLTVASIGPITSATLRERGVRIDVESQVHTIEGLLDALDEYFAR